MPEPRLHMDTIISLRFSHENFSTTCTWGEFLQANPPDEDEDVLRIEQDLIHRGEATAGGGAAPVCFITVVQP